jgi:hypothetical protein
MNFSVSIALVERKCTCDDIQIGVTITKIQIYFAPSRRMLDPCDLHVNLDD